MEVTIFFGSCFAPLGECRDVCPLFVSGADTLLVGRTITEVLRAKSAVRSSVQFTSVRIGQLPLSQYNNQLKFCGITFFVFYAWLLTQAAIDIEAGTRD